MIRITGLTARDTWHSVSPDGRTRLHVEVHTGDASHAVVRAVRTVGTGPAAQIAAANAAFHLKRGRRVTVDGAGLGLINGHLVVIGCDCIHPDDAIAQRALEGAGA